MKMPSEFYPIDQMENFVEQEEADDFLKIADRIPCVLYQNQCLYLFEIEVDGKKYYMEVRALVHSFIEEM